MKMQDTASMQLVLYDICMLVCMWYFREEYQWITHLLWMQGLFNHSDWCCDSKAYPVNVSDLHFRIHKVTLVSGCSKLLISQKHYDNWRSRPLNWPFWEFESTSSVVFANPEWRSGSGGHCFNSEWPTLCSNDMILAILRILRSKSQAEKTQPSANQQKRFMCGGVASYAVMCRSFVKKTQCNS